MALSTKIVEKLQAKAKQVEQKMVALETRIKTGRLRASIKMEFDRVKSAFVFKAVYYGKFQDEGTYSNKRQTPVSKELWPIYRPKGGRKGRGIYPLHFTDPVARDLDKQHIISVITPTLVEEAVKEVKKNIKKWQ
jgi:hypothetical protein